MCATPKRDIAFIALGSNVGDREAHLAFARQRLAGLPESRVVAVSTIEETDPVGLVPQERFLNQMIALETGLPPRALLRACLAIERARGRQRTTRWGPRTLDLDIVRYDAYTVDEPGLTIPHPELPRRPFWQRELAELESHVR